jgi:hypothetical protein
MGSVPCLGRSATAGCFSGADASRPPLEVHARQSTKAWIATNRLTSTSSKLRSKHLSAVPGCGSHPALIAPSGDIKFEIHAGQDTLVSEDERFRIGFQS